MLLLGNEKVRLHLFKLNFQSNGKQDILLFTLLFCHDAMILYDKGAPHLIFYFYLHAWDFPFPVENYVFVCYKSYEY